MKYTTKSQKIFMLVSQICVCVNSSNDKIVDYKYNKWRKHDFLKSWGRVGDYALQIKSEHKLYKIFIVILQFIIIH